MNATGVSATSYLGEFVTFLFQITILLAVLVAAVFALGWLLWWLARLLPRGAREALGKLFRHIYYDLFDGAWRLAILGSAAISLTIASAFTTWGGLTSFTEHTPNGEPTRVGLWLALAIASGIQAVMLIAAWIIGESFAAATPIRSGNTDARRRTIEQWIGMALGILLVVVAYVWLINGLDVTTLSTSQDFWRRLLTLAEIFACGLAAIGIAYCLRSNEFVGPYVQGLGVVAKNIVVWVMFLASLSMSLFFSFDYHFNAIFNATLRKETADSRAQQKLSAATNFLRDRMPKRLEEIQDTFFSGSAWTEYDAQLKRSQQIGERSPNLLQQRDQGLQAARRKRIADMEATLATLQTDIGPLELRSKTLHPALDSRKTQLTGAQKKLEDQKIKVDQMKQAVADAEAAAKREEGGVPGEGRTGNEGRGPQWLEAQKAVRLAKSNLAAAELENVPIKAQSDRLEKEINGILAELATFEPKLVDLTTRADTAKQTLKTERSADLAAEQAADPLSVLRTLATQTNNFRQKPTSEMLNEIKNNCAELKGIGKKVEDLDADRLDCDPKKVNEALTAFLAEKRRIDDFIPLCTTGKSIAGKGVDDMITFAQTCLQDSGLPAAELVSHYGLVRELREIRDDKAQSFVRTLTAVGDRNPLAGLALAIALIVDSLIFFAGVFAATTVTSPLQRAGLRDLARQVGQLPAREVRWALAAMRNHAFDERQCDDSRINQIVTLGLDRQIPTEAPGTALVRRAEHGDFSQYHLHQIYRDELQELVRRAERRGELRPEPAPDRPLPDAPVETPTGEERVVVFAPRRSAGRG